MRPENYGINILFIINLSVWQVIVKADNADIMKTISDSFGRQVHPCLKKLKLGDVILNDMLHYWEPNYKLNKKDVGCTIACANERLHLVKKNGDIIKANVAGFAKASGAGKEMAKTLVEVYEGCHKTSTSKDPCVKALETTNCFRHAIQESSWLPQMPAI